MDDPVEAARARMDALFRRAEGLRESAPTDSEFFNTFSEILEELEVAGEELRQQNEEIIATRNEVEKERERYQQLFEFAPDAYLVTNPRGLIQEANEAACLLLNVSYPNLVNKPLAVFVERGQVDLFHRIIAHPQKMRSFEMRILPRRQKAQDVAVTLAAIFDEKNRLTQLRWMMRDISERQRMYQALDASERRFRAIFDGASLGILLVTPEGVFERANSAYLEMIGYTEAELVGRDMTEFIVPEDTALVERALKEMAEERRGSGRFQVRCLRKDQTVAWADVSLSLLQDPQDDLRHILLLTEDITTRRAYEDELEEMRRRLLDSGEVERLRLAQELHDGPMQDLYGVVFRLADTASQEDTIKDPQVKSDLREMQDTIKQVAGTLRAVCGELRPPTIGHLGLERAIRSHAEGIQARNPDLNIELQLASDGSKLPPHVRMAFFRIYQQCVSNILRHAQATRVLVSFFVSDHEVILDVWDNGKGFTLPDRWVEFLREGHYGLAGIAERVDALGGKLKIDTKPGAGTLVHVTTPRTPKA